MSLNLRSLIYLLFMLAVAVAVALVAVALRPVQAHLADRPDLDKWAMGEYRVRINGEWIDVPPSAVVPSGNRYGQTLVWGYSSLGGSPAFIVRCFLPGAGG